MRHTPRSPLRTTLFLLLVLALLYVVIPQVGAFRLSLHLLADAVPLALLAALAATCLTFVIASFKYQALALKPLLFRRTLLLQLAGMLANRLLPAGVGAMGVNYVYLKKAKHTSTQAGAVVSFNTLLGFVGHSILVATLLVVYPSSRHFVHTPHVQTKWLLIALVAVVLCAIVACGITRKRWQAFERTLGRNLSLYKRQPQKIILAVVYSIILAALYGMILLYSATALHVTLGFGAALVVLTFGVTASTITPTPGGLIGVEAGLVAALLAYGINRADALAIALLYRFFTFWLALALGAMAFIYAENRKYI